MIRTRIQFLVWIGLGVGAAAGRTQSPDPIAYVVSFANPEKHLATVQATFPISDSGSIELMMPVWSPGFYRVENYAAKISTISASAPNGTVLTVEQPKKNRWRVKSGKVASVTVTYTLECTGRSVTTNWVGADYAVLNGPATFMTPVGEGKRTHDVTLILPAAWTKSATGLPRRDQPHTYRAPDYDTLVDSPIAVGKLDIHTFEVAGCPHSLVAFGDSVGWDAARSVADLEKLVSENHRLWGALPFKTYVFLLAFRSGGGGLEHLNSTLVTTSAAGLKSPRGYSSWLGLVSHEYVHAFNVKRLRPVELGPFDYEKEPSTASLWISEGLTSYYGNLVVTRAGLSSPEVYLGQLSAQITQLQNSPGRFLQSLEQSSREVWTNSMSGIGANAKTVSYYIKGEVAGFLLDARVRSATGGKKSLDDVMRLAYERHSGAKGFTPEEFRRAAEDVAGVDLGKWFQTVVAAPGELDYQDALDWFGLKVTKSEGAEGRKAWKLEQLHDASAEQKMHFQDWVRPVGKK